MFKEIIAKNFSKLVKDINLQIQEALKTLSKVSTKKSTPSIL